MIDETKHTPGPWSYRPAKYDDWGFVRAEPLPGERIGHLVAVAKDSAVPFEMHEFHRENGTDPFEANARLIAASPELLSAAKDIISSRSSTFRAKNGRRMSIEDDSGEMMWIVPFDEMTALESAIAKAEGHSK